MTGRDLREMVREMPSVAAQIDSALDARSLR